MSGLRTRTDVWSVGIVIPASNEARTIESCLKRVLSAARNVDCRRFWIAVVADACSDDTASIARRALGKTGEVLECAKRSVGSARRIGARAVFEHFGDFDPKTTWLANTDADTYVPANWLRVHLSLADSGARAVAGIVELDRNEVSADVARLYRDTYKVAEDGSHEHVHGANLGVRADAYLEVGGWSELALSEDHHLWHRLAQRGWSLRSSAESIVRTSGRLSGRARGGFADTLMRELRARE